MTIILDGTAGIQNNATDLSYTGTLTGGTGVVNLGSGQVYKDASGNVGIGTSSPNGKLDVKTAADSKLIFNEGSTAGNVRLEAANLAYSAYKPLELNGSIQMFATGGTERARIDPSGNLLVGQTSGGLLNSNSFSLQPTSAGSAWASHANGSASGNGYWFFGYNGGSIGSITQNGTTAVAYNTTSDYRLKENIMPLTGALARIAALKPCTYTWKKAPDETGEGFIAHELAEVCPQATTGEKDAVDAEGNPQYQGIDTSFLVATLTAAIQEQQTLITALTALTSALEERLTALEATNV